MCYYQYGWSSIIGTIKLKVPTSFYKNILYKKKKKQLMW
jgi:hypothetical protein